MHSTRWRHLAAAAAAGAVLAALLTGPATPAAAAAPARLETPTEADTTGDAAALLKAHDTGKPVDATAATTETSTLAANPDGSMTLTQAAVPQRKRVNGAWKDLDPTLSTRADGTITPAVATGDLHLLDGGDGPLATMSGGGRSLSLTLPFTLPKPTLDGATATYDSVLPGVDLQVSADAQGGFSQVLVVADAAAAANPDIAALTMAMQTHGIDLAADGAGNIVGTDVNHNVVVAAPAPTMWDSAQSSAKASTVTAPKTGIKLDAKSGMPVTSSASGPGTGAHVAPLGVRMSAGALTLTPPPSLLKSATWPVYIDPGWSWGAAQNGYAVIDNSRPNDKFWKDSPSPTKDLQSGHDPEMGEVRRTLVNFPIDTSRLTKDAIISSATLNITETWSNSCTASQVNIYAPTPFVTANNAYWNAWAGVSLGNPIDTVSTAHGWNSSCPAAGVGFDILTGIKAAAAGARKNQTFVIRAADESADSGWKRWSASTPKITVTYDHKPNTPTGLHTSPLTSCTGSTIGDHDIKLYATVSDRDGGTVSENFTVWKSSNSTVKTTGTFNNVASGSGATPFTVKQSWMEGAAAGQKTVFAWNLTASQNGLTSAASSTCSFTFDPTRPHEPDVTVPDTATIGQPATFTASYTKNPGETTAPASYQYQLNSGAVRTVKADSNGNATFTATPMRTTNFINVTAASAGNNFSTTAADDVLRADPPAPATDQDMTGDGNPDLLTVGGTNNLPAGVWVAYGTNHLANPLNAVPTDIGVFGSGAGTVGSPTDFTGTQVITGKFTGDNMQDLLYYNPTGTKAGSGGVLTGNGDGSPIVPTAGENLISTGTLTDVSGSIFSEPTTLANAGDSSASGTGYLDLIGISGNPTDGYHLIYYPNTGGPVFWAASYPLTTPTPDGAMDWDAWTITTTQTSTGTGMFLWNKTTGALSLWTGLGFTTDNGDSTLTYTPHTLADGTASKFNPGTTANLQAADINHDGAPDLWTTAANAVTTTWLNNANTAMTADASQLMISPTHAWALNDGDPSGADDIPITGAADTIGSTPVTGNVGVTWNTGGLFDPDAAFNGTNGALSASNLAVDNRADFTVSAWAKPTGPGQYVFSQDGAHQSSFVLFTGTDNEWYFGIAKADTGTASYDVVHNTEGPVHYNLWQHITATYHASSRTMALYVDGNPVFAITRPAATANGNGIFKIGDYEPNGTHAGFFNGEIADVQTWNTALSPDQITTIANVRDRILFPSDDTAYPSGSTWTSPCATMTFSQGQLAIKETCTKSDTVTFGTTGNPGAALVLQSDGNLVIYKTATAAHTAGNALWSAATSGNHGDSMFLQPDGNLVIYAATGAVVWDSGTFNNPQ
jgi:hypothetical protein